MSTTTIYILIIIFTIILLKIISSIEHINHNLENMQKQISEINAGVQVTVVALYRIMTDYMNLSMDPNDDKQEDNKTN